MIHIQLTDAERAHLDQSLATQRSGFRQLLVLVREELAEQSDAEAVVALNVILSRSEWTPGEVMSMFSWLVVQHARGQIGEVTGRGGQP